MNSHFFIKVIGFEAHSKAQQKSPRIENTITVIRLLQRR